MQMIPCTERGLVACALHACIVHCARRSSGDSERCSPILRHILGFILAASLNDIAHNRLAALRYIYIQHLSLHMIGAELQMPIPLGRSRPD